MALIYDEIRGWHVADDKPDSPLADAYRPIIEGLEDGLDGNDNRRKWIQSIGRIIKGSDTPIIIDYSFETDQMKDEKQSLTRYLKKRY